MSPTDSRPRLEPGPDHPISVSSSPDQVTVRYHDLIVARSGRALELSEADYPVVLYLPLEDVVAEALRPSGEHTYCPYKGEASYYDLVGAGEQSPGAVWYYPDPHPPVAAIAGHVAFYPDRVTITAD
jgi:uncharacterized protein (DUF427 family)